MLEMIGGIDMIRPKGFRLSGRYACLQSCDASCPAKRGRHGEFEDSVIELR